MATSIPIKNNKVYLDTSVISALFDARTPERMFQIPAVVQRRYTIKNGEWRIMNRP